MKAVPVLDLRLLGPLVVRVDQNEVAVRARKQRVLLATLLLNPNRVVPVDRIAEALWGESAPPTAAATVRTYVMRLRQVLGPVAGGRIYTRAPGYMMIVHEDETDVGRFRLGRVRASRAIAQGDLQAAVEHLNQALGLWANEPLMDVPSRVLQKTEGRHLQELRLQTMLWLFDLELTLGRHAECLPRLWRVVREQPLNEALVARLMRGLAGSGRQAEAFSLFHQTRRTLVETLGAEPGGELQDAYQLILQGAAEPASPGPARSDEGRFPVQAGPSELEVTGRPGGDPQPQPPVPDLPPKPALPDPPAAARPMAPGEVRPAQLPSAPPKYLDTGNTVPQIEQWLREDEPGITVITGSSGSGKTALALQVAHQVLDAFPDGQLFTELSGPDGETIAPAQVLRHFLAGLGVSESEMPSSEPQALALFRTLTARKRVLAVLDAAVDTAQVRTLLPGGPGCRVLVTSTRPLTDLEGMRPVVLRPLDVDAGVELLTQMIGPERVQEQPEDARRIVASCSGVPLAIRIAGGRLLSRPHWPLSLLADRLGETHRLLDELTLGGLDVRRGLNQALRRMEGQTLAGTSLVRTWQRLALIRRDVLDPEQLAPWMGMDQAVLEELMDLLVEGHLLDGRPYRMNPLQKAFAWERVEITSAVRPRGQDREKTDGDGRSMTA